MKSTFKQFLMLVAVVGLLAGCASTSTEDQQAADQDDQAAQQRDQIQERDRAQQEQEQEQEDVATVFYFGFDESTLRPDARAALTVHAERLRENPRPVRVEGHADERGSREYNMALGERRANAVRDFLVLQGVDPSLIETVSYGEERPAVMGSYEGSWAQNRRVEIKY